MTIQEIASANDASIITDKDGDVALLCRLYDDEGRSVVRYAPDPCDYLPQEQWEAMTAEEAASRVC